MRSCPISWSGNTARGLLGSECSNLWVEVFEMLVFVCFFIVINAYLRLCLLVSYPLNLSN